MKLGLHINEMRWGDGQRSLGQTLGEIVEAAENSGFDVVAMADHLWLSPYVGGPLGNHLEAYTSLGFLAARTKRVRLLTLATAATYRPAGLLAKIVTTLDVLSGGRAMLGIGAGDYADEAEGFGLPFQSRTGGPGTSRENARQSRSVRSRGNTIGTPRRSGSSALG